MKAASVKGQGRKPAAGNPAKIKRADFVSAFARGLDVIRAFDAETPRLTIADASLRTGLNRAASRRLLLTLVELGYARMEGEHFSLLPKVLEIGFAYVSTWQIDALVAPYLREVVDTLNENSSVGVLDGDEVVYVARQEVRRIVQSMSVTVGTRLPANVSALGRVLIAHLPQDEQKLRFARNPAWAKRHPGLEAELAEIRTRGFAFVNQEFEQGLMSVAVPLRGHGDTVVGAINVGAPTTRATPDEMLGRFLPVLREAGDAISAALKLRQEAGVPVTLGPLRFGPDGTLVATA